MKPSTRLTLALLRMYPHGVSPLDALEHGAGLRLSGRILELRRLGFDIETTYETAMTGGRYARYILHEQPMQLVAGF